jgi:hypothetical protein
MRHIPEEELHAYLDQGLSRSQCVEIESHLADCPVCRSQRDGIAALRDRTTALLARLAPPRQIPPAFEVLRARAADADSLRRRRLRGIAWAASLVAAVGLGWSASSAVRDREAPASVAAAARPASPPPRPATSIAAPVASAPPTAMLPIRTATARRAPSDSAAPRTPARAATPRRAEVVAPSAADKRTAALSVLDQAPAVELTRLDRSSGAGEVELDGMWRTMSWDGARAETGDHLPHIDGLPVLRVQVQGGEEGAQPVMVVAQRLASGQVIRTIEGPATDVSQLLSRRSAAEVNTLLPGDTATPSADPGSHAMAMQVGDRMLAITGDLPPDSLRAMIRRLNAELRSK